MLVLAVVRSFLLGLTSSQPFVVKNEAWKKSKQEIQHCHDSTKHHLAVAFKHSGEEDSKNDDVKQDTEQVDYQTKRDRFWAGGLT